MMMITINIRNAYLVVWTGMINVVKCVNEPTIPDMLSIDLLSTIIECDAKIAENL
jgi:hypothetical protein